MKRLVLIAALACSACGSPTTPSAPTPVPLDLSGTWNGTYSSAVLGFGSAVVTLSQIGSTVSGTWSTRPSANGGSGVGAGTVGGSTGGATGNTGTFTLTMSPSDPRNCPFSSTVTVFLAQRQMTGQWVTINCTVTASGTLILSKH